MVEVLKSFEQVAGRLNSLVLIVPGLVMVAAGLFVWLGGLGMRRAVFAVLGAAAGEVIAVLLITRNVTFIGISAIVTACLAASFQRLFIALLLGLLAFGAAFAVLARPGLMEFQGALVGGEKDGPRDQKLTADDSLQVARAYGLDLVDGIRYAAGRLIPAQWAIIAAAATGLMAFGALFRSVGAAMACATLGTALIFVGLLALLIFKGSTPVERMESRPAFYGLVFTGMAIFGTLEQLALCRKAATGRSKGKSSGQEPDKASSKRSWRNR
jgi:hypothetical protein